MCCAKEVKRSRYGVRLVMLVEKRDVVRVKKGEISWKK